jgi:Tfp pilus assembly protein PilN
MIRINLLDESKMSIQLNEASSSDEKTTSLQAPWFKSWLILGSSIAGFLWILYFGYYWFMIRSPLNTIVEELAIHQKTLDILKPEVAENEVLGKKKEEVKAECDEYEKFINSKKNWARVLNVLSDELPEEIVFKKLEVFVKPYQMKHRTAGGGLALDFVDCFVVEIEMEIREEFQAKVSAYMRKIQENPWIKAILVGIEDSGMNWDQSQNIFATRVDLFFLKSEPSRDENSLSVGKPS